MKYETPVVDAQLAPAFAGSKPDLLICFPGACAPGFMPTPAPQATGGKGARTEVGMKINKFIAILVVLFAPCVGMAQSAPTQWLTETERAKFETLRVAGSEALF